MDVQYVVLMSTGKMSAQIKELPKTEGQVGVEGEIITPPGSEVKGTEAVAVGKVVVEME